MVNGDGRSGRGRHESAENDDLSTATTDASPIVEVQRGSRLRVGAVVVHQAEGLLREGRVGGTAVFSTTDAVILLDADAAGHSTADAVAGGGRRPGSSSSGTRSGRIRGRLLRLLLCRRISQRTRPAELGRETGDLGVPIPPDSPARRFEVADDARPVAGRNSRRSRRARPRPRCSSCRPGTYTCSAKIRRSWRRARRPSSSRRASTIGSGGPRSAGPSPACRGVTLRRICPRRSPWPD
jgi:hypothetical protein